MNRRAFMNTKTDNVFSIKKNLLQLVNLENVK